MTEQKSEQKKGSTQQSAEPILIKKYPNRRLYDTSESRYIVLDDIVTMVKADTAFVIQDAKTGEDITRSILNQVIYERETRSPHAHFSLDVLKQLIGMYDDSYAHMVPDYLRQSMAVFSKERQRMAETYGEVLENNASAMMRFNRKMAERNMELWRQSMSAFMPGMVKAGDDPLADSTAIAKDAERLSDLQKQIDALHAKLDALKDE